MPFPLVSPSSLRGGDSGGLPAPELRRSAQVRARTNKAHAQLCPRGPPGAQARARRPGAPAPVRALGRDLPAPSSAPGKRSVQLGSPSRPNSAQRDRQAGLPVRGGLGRRGRSWPQPGGGDGRQPGQRWALGLCPHPGARGGVGGPEAKREVGHKARPAAGQPARRCQPGERSAKPGAGVPAPSSASGVPPGQDRVSQSDLHRATHVLTWRPPLSPGALAREPSTHCRS